jgi:hypothetical protein
LNNLIGLFLEIDCCPEGSEEERSDNETETYRRGFKTLAAVGLECEKGPYEGDKPRNSVYPAT